MVLDEALEERIAEIVRPLLKRWPNLDTEAIRDGNRKQAMVPQGATVLEPVGTAPGLVVPPSPSAAERPDGGRAARARRASCSRCGSTAVADRGAARRDRGRDRLRQRMLRLFGIPESEIAETLRVAEARGRRARAASRSPRA